MISNALETLGFGFAILAAYELSGKAAAFVTIAAILLFVGFVLDGVKLRVPERLKRKPPEKQKLKLVDEPLTNRELDQIQQAMRE